MPAEQILRVMHAHRPVPVHGVDQGAPARPRKARQAGAESVMDVVDAFEQEQVFHTVSFDFSAVLTHAPNRVNAPSVFDLAPFLSALSMIFMNPGGTHA